MWSDTFNKVEQGLAQGPLCWVEVMDSRGSVPRERGAWMAVFADMGASLLVVGNGLRLLRR